MTQQFNQEAYWDKVAKNIAIRQDTSFIAGDDEPYYRYKRKRFLNLLDRIDFRNKLVLEVGSGPGGNLNFIYNKGVKGITGADISNKMIVLSKSLLQGKNIQIVKINGTELPFDSASFDLVFTSTVLQHNTDEQVLKKLVAEICRVSKNEVILFERIEQKITGHESNLGRPISYYSDLLKKNSFKLVETVFLPIQASYFICGIIRKVFNPKDHFEGQPLTKLSTVLENICLPVTSMLDTVIPSKRDVAMLKFQRQ